MSNRLAALFALPLTLALVLVGCADRDRSSDASGAPSAAATNPTPAADRWLGQWNGPEGTFLRVEGGKGKYQITIRDLDGPRTFQGRAVGDRVSFDRDGATETIRATNGLDTGMKWLSQKSDCLTIRPGEGYCRD